MAELVADLTPDDRALIESVRAAKREADNALDVYARSIRHALGRSERLSYGVLGHELGIAKESIWRSVQRYVARFGTG